MLMITIRARRPFAISAVKSMLMIATRARRPFATSEALLEEHADDRRSGQAAVAELAGPAAVSIARRIGAPSGDADWRVRQLVCCRRLSKRMEVRGGRPSGVY